MVQARIKPIKNAREIAQSNFERLLKDRNYVAAIDKLDRTRIHQEFENIKEEYVEFISFYTYRRHMKIMKVRRGKLSPAVEKRVVARGKQALTAYQNITKRLQVISDALVRSKLGPTLNRHVPHLFEQLEHNPKFPVIVDEFRAMGVPEDALLWVINKLREAKYNPFEVAGGKLGFAGITRQAAQLTPKLQRDLTLTSKRGLAVLAGAGDDEDEYVAAGITIAVAIIVGLFVGFCHDWRDAALPHVKHWEA